MNFLKSLIFLIFAIFLFPVTIIGFLFYLVFAAFMAGFNAGETFAFWVDKDESKK